MFRAAGVARCVVRLRTRRWGADISAESPTLRESSTFFVLTWKSHWRRISIFETSANLVILTVTGMTEPSRVTVATADSAKTDPLICRLRQTICFCHKPYQSRPYRTERVVREKKGMVTEPKLLKRWKSAQPQIFHRKAVKEFPLPPSPA
ncbi:hypothetical protein BaRGS_00014591 [Batillaria attramentaria]|uniref:Uncharacterized protein n=1 Tax=Batillaria attramentaria TaxID=370345 RepID=A0ABD0L4I3_9CAEN